MGSIHLPSIETKNSGSMTARREIVDVTRTASPPPRPARWRKITFWLQNVQNRIKKYDVHIKSVQNRLEMLLQPKIFILYQVALSVSPLLSAPAHAMSRLKNCRHRYVPVPSTSSQNHLPRRRVPEITPTTASTNQSSQKLHRYASATSLPSAPLALSSLLLILLQTSMASMPAP